MNSILSRLNNRKFLEVRYMTAVIRFGELSCLIMLRLLTELAK